MDPKLRRFMKRAVACGILLAMADAHAGVATAAAPAHARIPDDTPLDAVKWTGGFWQDRMRRLRDVYLPGVLDGSFMSVENGSTFLNLLRAAKLEQGGAQGSTWSDGDCYLVLDTVARLQAHRPDAYLKGKIDTWIPILAKIQREDGLVDSWTVLGQFDATHGKPWRWQIKKGEAFHGALHYNTGSLYAFASTLRRATGDGRALAIAECTPNARASYEQAATTPRPSGEPPTITGNPLSSGLSSCSTDAKNASIST